MKLSILYIITGAVLLVSSAVAGAAESDSRLTMPGDIKPEKITAQERNPFERRVELQTEDDRGTELSEEDRIRQKFHDFKVRGGTAGVRVLISDMILEKGKKVAPVLPDQTINLVVSELTTDEIVLTWIDDLDKKRPRTIVVPYDLTPRVASLMSGQTEMDDREKRVMMERVMTRADRPSMPVLRVKDGDGKVHEVDTGSVAGQ